MNLLLMSNKLINSSKSGSSYSSVMGLGTSGALFERGDWIGVASVCEEGEIEGSTGIGVVSLEKLVGKS